MSLPKKENKLASHVAFDHVDYNTGDCKIEERCHSYGQVKAVEGDGEAEELMEH